MTTLMLAVLGWCVASMAVAGLWAAVCAGARRGAAANVAAWQQPQPQRAARVLPAGLVPAPRAAAADAPLAV